MLLSFVLTFVICVLCGFVSGWLVHLGLGWLLVVSSFCGVWFGSCLLGFCCLFFCLKIKHLCIMFDEFCLWASLILREISFDHYLTYWPLILPVSLVEFLSSQYYGDWLWLRNYFFFSPVNEPYVCFIFYHNRIIHIFTTIEPYLLWLFCKMCT